MLVIIVLHTAAYRDLGDRLCSVPAATACADVSVAGDTVATSETMCKTLVTAAGTICQWTQTGTTVATTSCSGATGTAAITLAINNVMNRVGGVIGGAIVGVGGGLVGEPRLRTPYCV